jgi:hypothetical protein
VWQPAARVAIGSQGIRCITAQDDFLYSQPFGGTQQTADIVAATQIVGDQYDVSLHDLRIVSKN